MTLSFKILFLKMSFMSLRNCNTFLEKCLVLILYLFGLNNYKILGKWYC